MRTGSPAATDTTRIVNFVRDILCDAPRGWHPLLNLTSVPADVLPSEKHRPLLVQHLDPGGQRSSLPVHVALAFRGHNARRAVVELRGCLGTAGTGHAAATGAAGARSPTADEGGRPRPRPVRRFQSLS
jgi:hypothetical protein